MKKGFWKRWLVGMGLTAAMAVGLCACGGGGEEADPALAKENVYRMQEIELPQLYEPGNGNMNIVTSARKNGKVYVVAQVYDWNSWKDNDYRLISMKEDGSDVQMTTFELQEVESGNMGGTVIPETPVEDLDDVVTDDSESEAEIASEESEPENAIEPRVNDTESGENDTESGENDAESGENGGASEDGWQKAGEYINYSQFTIASDGLVYGVKNHNIDEYNDAGEYRSKRESSVCCWSPEDGKLLWESGLGEMDDRTWINMVMEGTDGALYLIVAVNNEDYSETDYYKIRAGADGSVGDRVKLSDASQEILGNYERMLPWENGTSLVLFRDEEDWNKEFYASYDVVSDTLGETKTFPSIVSQNSYGVMIPGIANDLIYVGNGGIYCWNEGDTENRMMVNYINSDLFIQNIFNIIELNENSFLSFFQEDYESGMKAGIFTYVDPADIKDKQVLVMAGNYIGTDLKKRVIEYNRNNADYRIVLKEYNIYNDYSAEDGYKMGITKLNNDIITGSMPDILVPDNGMPINNYISTGLVADIDKLLEEDEELSQVEFMQNAFDAYRVDGKLYQIVPDFEVYTVMAKKSLVGDRTGWTMEDMQQVLAGMGESASAFGGDVTRNSFMNMVMRYCGNQFVDLSTGLCSFNTEDFISMMEYAKSLPTDNESSADYDEDYWNDYWQNYESQYRENRTLMMQANFWRFDNVIYSINGQFGEDVSYVGFPTETGNGSYVMSSNTYALSAKSKHLDEAWNFMRYFLTEEYQDQTNYFPVRRDKFLEKSKVAMERPTYTWTDENGEEHVEYEDLSIWINGEAVPYEPLSQGQLDELVAFIESVHNPYYYNEDIMLIINEEIDGFFTGQKPARDVADVIQRRVQNYVDENS